METDLRPPIAWLVAALLLGMALPADAFLTTTIQIDGEYGDWQSVLASPENNLVDRAASAGDPDMPTDASRDLRRFAVTWDNTNLYFYWQRSTEEDSGRDKKNFVLLAYLDLNDDGLMTLADAVLMLRFDHDELRDNGLFRYVPSNISDTMPGDGQDIAGSALNDLGATVTGYAEPDAKRQFEASVPWLHLGISIPGQPIRIQPAVADLKDIADDVAEYAPLLPQGVIDNGSVFSTRHVGVELSAALQASGAPGTQVELPHRLTSRGNRPQSIDLSVMTTNGMATELWTAPGPSSGTLIAIDGNGDGDYYDAGDSIAAGWDRTADLRPDTPVLSSGGTFDLVVIVHLPISGFDVNREVVLVATSQYDPAAYASVTDRVRAHRLTVTPTYDRTVVAGTAVPMHHSACNNDPTPMMVNVSAFTDIGWATSVLIGGAIGGSGTIDAGDCVEITVSVQVPPGAALGTEGNLTILVWSAGSTLMVPTEDRLTVAPAVSLIEDRAGFALAGSAAFYPHTLINSSATALQFNLTSDLPGTRFWTDPNGDGRPGDGSQLAVTPLLDPFGGRFQFLAQIPVDDALDPGDLVTAAVRARDTGSTLPQVTATDRTTVERLETLAGIPPALPTDVFAGCSTVHAWAGPLDDRQHRMKWFDPFGFLIRVSPAMDPDSAGMISDELRLVVGDEPGSWRLELEEYRNSAWSLVDGGQRDFSVVRELAGQAGISTLSINRTDYPMSGGSMSITATLSNHSALNFVGSSFEVVAFLDVDQDGLPTLDEPYLRLDGREDDWSPGAVTCRVTGLPALNAGASWFESSCRDIMPTEFSSAGAWTLRATWESSCNDPLATRGTTFNVGCGATALVDAGENRLICTGDLTLLGVGPPEPGTTYLWDPPDTLDDPGACQPWASPAGTTTYAVNAFDFNGCAARDEVVVAVMPAPVVDAGPSQTICLGASVQIGLPGSAGRTYLWNPATGLDNPSAARPIATPTTNTIYTLTVTDQATSCEATDVAVVDVLPLPSANAGADRPIGATIGPTSCDPNLAYQWTPATGLDAANVCNPVATPATTTSYCLQVTNRSSGCTSLPDCVNVVDGDCPDPPDAGPDAMAPARLGPGTCSANSTYLWTPATGLDDPFACNPTANPTTTTEYCLTVLDTISSCESLPDCTIVTADCQPPSAISQLRLSRVDADVQLGWDRDVMALGGYRAYRFEAKAELIDPLAGTVLFTTAGVDMLDGLDPGAASPPPASSPLYLYQVVGVCTDGITEGP